MLFPLCVFTSFLMLESRIVDGLKCLKCNSITHGPRCGSDAMSLTDNSSLVERCHGTCRVSKIKSANGREVHLRDCANAKGTGCALRNFPSSDGKRKSLPGQLCQCDRDFCNVDFTFSKENRPPVTLHLQVSLSDQNSTGTTWRTISMQCLLISTILFSLFKT
ncbi:uncharacterized protein LOC125656881 [Ostrea edulis]|uniref:uncharacterized protein LOC125656881 n=1 Tax=Ostrea edulis TaxID=37623 RepID=UPI0024AFE9DA|nr:uncharacterized protein LOC125656881 [Ostrea edulis]